MEGSGEPGGRKRKMKFEPTEVEILVEEANKNLAELEGKNLNITRRAAIWEDICKKVNAVGQTKRTADEVKRRWHDLRRRTKGKIAHNKRSANKTGGGPSEEIPLTNVEEQVQLTFCEEQITGVSGYDTLEQDAEQDFVPGVQSPPHSSHQAQARPPAAEPRKHSEDMDEELLLQLNKQSAVLKDGLSAVAQESCQFQRLQNAAARARSGDRENN
ncbi:myb-related transcription factor, partner of profilin-like [Melanotaenia boesemani]|uniref:myb-related transcription factor, partner of profilin-like n=1 Tax=Melanotaenia boesemani TaxID=1250792 RepID=UPI001C046C66|nr:myb-related transcription factor, partner of profilin-like [Melanotaenia boesemani]